jgi:hypothetical protein
VKLDITRVRNLLQEFDFKSIFIEELGWSQPAQIKTSAIVVDNNEYEIRQVAQLSGVVVFEIKAKDGRIPDAKKRTAIHKEISKHHHENLLIFLDGVRTQSLWYWVKRENKKTFPRDHLYVKGQPGDLFLSKLGAMVVDISELDETGNIPVTEVANRLREALDIERVTKKFYREYADERVHFTELIEGIDNDRDRRWYASILLNRLMFIYFLQQKYFLDGGNINYLQNKLTDTNQTQGNNKYYSIFLKSLFFEGFAKPEKERSPEARKLLGDIKYLNGGLFLPHRIENNYQNIQVPDKAFENIFHLFGRYSWNLNDIPGGRDDEINPDVLGYIFEKYINQKAFGAYYTRPEITEYLCEHTIYKLILDKINIEGIPGVMQARKFDSMADLLLNLDTSLCRELLMDVLPSLSLLDPACGSGAFLVAAMKTLINLYSAIIGKIEFVNDRNLTDWLKKAKAEHKSISYFIKKTIITDNLFGVDIMEEASEIAKLRLFLALVASARSVDELEPLPNIDFNILVGNSLIGLMHVDDKAFDSRATQGNLFRKRYREVLAEKNRLISNYRHAASYSSDLRTLRDNIDKIKTDARETLNDILLAEFINLGIKYEEAAWDTTKNKQGKPKKRKLTITEIEDLTPFHWGYEFDEIINKRGGFDAIITNPPWEIFKPQAKEFFAEHSDLVTKNKMTIKEFEKEQTKLMKSAEISDAWIEYASRFPYLSQFFRSAEQFKNQIAVIKGKKAGTDINLYKLFVEQCYNLLRRGGECGIVIPSGIYTDLGTKQLRELLFGQNEVTGLFCFENRKDIFEGVDCRFKFVVLTYKKGGKTAAFPAAFMRHDVSELERFPQEGAIHILLKLVRHLSPDAIAIPEIKNDLELHFLDRISQHTAIDNEQSSYQHIKFCREIDPTAHPESFSTENHKGLFPLLEGRNIHQFTYIFSTEVRFWLKEEAGRKLVLGREADRGQLLDYQVCRLGFRKIASSTNERTMISTIIPPSFASENFQTVMVIDKNGKRIVSNTDMLMLSAIFNSFVFDAILRLKVSANINFFFIYSSQVPKKGTLYDSRITERAARLICTTPKFDDLAKEVGMGSHKKGVTNEVERARLRAEIDGLVAHLYGLTEEEFAYILTTFPLVPDPVRVSALNAFRDIERGLIK